MTRAHGAREVAATMALALALSLGTSGCSNPFLPQQAEAPLPTGSSYVVPIDLLNQDGVLATLSGAMFAKGRGNGPTAYMATFADSSTQGFGFYVDFDPSVVADRISAGKPIPPSWDRQLELAFYNYLVALDRGEYTLDLEPNEITDVDDAPDHSIWYRTYTLTSLQDDGFTVVPIAKGRVALEMRRLPGTVVNWVIVRWTDTIISPETGPDPQDPGLRSFSRLRIESYSTSQPGGTP